MYVEEAKTGDTNCVSTPEHTCSHFASSLESCRGASGGGTEGTSLLVGDVLNQAILSEDVTVWTRYNLEVTMNQKHQMKYLN